MQSFPHSDEKVIPNKLCNICTRMFNVYTSGELWEPRLEDSEESRRPIREHDESPWSFDWYNGPDFHGPRVDFYETPLQFLDSVERGCHICSLFRRKTRRYVTEEEDKRKGRLVIEPCPNRSVEVAGCQKVKIRLRFTESDESDKMMPDVADPIIVHRHELDKDHSVCTADQSKLQKDSLEMQNRWTSHTRSSVGFEMLRTWLHTCVEGHSSCQAGLLRYSRQPTRLLDLKAFSASDDLRLVDCQDLIGSYATLSYRWGGSNLATLRRENYSQMRARIRFTDLSRSIREAIEVCRELSVRYLWVDALCIVQDRNDDDFKREIANMGSIYAGSLFNIAASDSIDSESGLFRSRSPLHRQDCVIESGRIRWVFQTTHVYCGRHDSHIQFSPLNGRGWVFQEELMSPRTIHFTSEDIIWECRERLFCQSCVKDTVTPHSPWSEYQRVDRTVWEARECRFWNYARIGGTLNRPSVQVPWYYGKRAPISLLMQSSGLHPRRIFHVGWGYCLERYTTTELTESNDRLSALAGIAQLIQSKLRYTASYGLWLDFFVDQLQWYLVQYDEKRSDIHEQIPSWSWLSTEGSISAVKEVVEDIRTARITRYPPITGFQPLSDLHERLPRPASFMVYGSIRPCQAYPWFDDGSMDWDIAPVSDEVPDFVESSIQEQWDTHTHFMDDGLEEPPGNFRFGHTSTVRFFPDVILKSREKLFCFLLNRVVDARDMIKDHGLVLRQDDLTPTRYRRVGYFDECGYDRPSPRQGYTSHPLTDGDPDEDIPTIPDFGDLTLSQDSHDDSDILRTSGQDEDAATSFLPEYGPEDANSISSLQSPAEPLENDDTEEKDTEENESEENETASYLLASSGTHVPRSDTEAEEEVIYAENPRAAHWMEQIEKFTFFNGSEIDMEIEIA